MDKVVSSLLARLQQEANIKQGERGPGANIAMKTAGAVQELEVTGELWGTT